MDNLNPQTDGQSAMPTPPQRSRAYVIGAVVVILIVGGVLFAMVWPRMTKQSIVPSTTTTTVGDLPTDGTGTTAGEWQQPTPTAVSSGTDEFGQYTLVQDPNGQQYYKDYSVALHGGSVVVAWNRGAKPLTQTDTETLLHQIDPKITGNIIHDPSFEDSGCTPDSDGVNPCQLYIFEMGQVTAPQMLAGKKVYGLFVSIMGPSFSAAFDQMLAMYDEHTHKFIQLTVDSYPRILQSVTGGIIPSNFPELSAPNLLQAVDANGQQVRLIFKKSYDTELVVNGKIQRQSSRLSTIDNFGGIIDVSKGILDSYNEFTSDTIRYNHATRYGKDYGPVYFKNRAYSIILPDGSIKEYDLLPSFLVTTAPTESDKNFYPSTYSVKISWSDGRTESSTEQYELGGTIRTQSCFAGVIPCTNIVSNESWFSVDKLREVGKTNDGDPVYDLSDAATNPYYKSIYDFGFLGWKISSGKITYDDAMKNSAAKSAQYYKEFLADHPVFFWKDGDGNWRVYQKSHYQSIAECGKPVIYLYPEHDTTVRVAVTPDGGLTKTEPAYGSGGWTVLASPNGSLYNPSDKKTYPYLFWEGRALHYVRPTQGFVLSAAQVPSAMRKLLAAQGLTEKESNDFIEFWQAKLQVKPYVFVTFVPQPQFDTMAPLTVTPRPDTVIRVFMDYEPLDRPVTVLPQPLHATKRTGFTVVEWGGALHGE